LNKFDSMSLLAGKSSLLLLLQIICFLKQNFKAKLLEKSN